MIVNEFQWVNNELKPSKSRSQNINPDLPLKIKDGQNALPNMNEINLCLKQGITVIKVENEITLINSVKTLEFIKFLRDCTSCGLRVLWGGNTQKDFPLEQLYHLFPPVFPFSGANQEIVENWKKQFRYDQFNLRKGPDFIKIKDRRLNKSPVTYTIGDPVIVSLFEKLDVNPYMSLEKMTNIELAAIELLLKHQLLLQLDNSVVALPVRSKIPKVNNI